MVESPSRPSFVLIIESDISSVSSSNEPILSVKVIGSTVSDDSDFLEPTQDPVPEDESCSGLAEIQVRAIDLFSVHSNILIVPTDIRMFDYVDQDESLEDDPNYDPFVANPDPSFDRNNLH